MNAPYRAPEEEATERGKMVVKAEEARLLPIATTSRNGHNC
jgi:hypothetical protein